MFLLPFDLTKYLLSLSTSLDFITILRSLDVYIYIYINIYIASCIFLSTRSVLKVVVQFGHVSAANPIKTNNR